MTQEVVSVHRLRAEHVLDGVLGVAKPRLSWQTQAPAGWLQKDHQLRVRRAGAWIESARTAGDQQLLVAWPFPPLASREVVEVCVRVRGVDTESDWSEPLRIEAGLLQRSDWRVQLVQPPRTGDDLCAYLRNEFEVDATELEGGRLYVSAQGVYDLRINGEPVGDQRLAPGWTSYRHRLRYQVLDVSGLLRPGRNVLAARLADGWFTGRLGWWKGGLRQNYGERNGLLAQLELRRPDGSVRLVAGAAGWRCGSGGIVSTSFYDGESFVADLEPAGWDLPGFDDSSWVQADVAPLPTAELVGPQFPAIAVVETLPVQRWFTSPSGVTIADFGQVITGHVRLAMRGAPASTATLRFAEVLDGGEMGLRPQRTATNQDRVTSGASGEIEWEPAFTFRSFRYASLDDPSGAVLRDQFVGRMVRNALPRTGWFECSDEELNRLHENAAWGIADNMLDVPTDCMLRDERLGWIGDAAHVAPTTAFLYDTAGWHSSWLEDLALDQRPNGSPPMVVPDVPLVPFPGDYPVAIFSDAACMAPAVVYERFGDSQMLRHQLPSMAAWVNCVAAEVLNGFPTPGFQFGDWLDPTAPPNNPENGLTEYDVVMALGAIRSAKLARDAADEVGDREVVAEMEHLHSQLLARFDEQFVSARGLVAGDSQTAYALALRVGALPDHKRAAAFDRLVTLLRRRGVLQAGYPGTYALMEVLVEFGRVDLAYRLLNNTGVPSWRFAVRLGATTFWERWDSLLADGSLNPGDMLSFNHPVFAGIADWMHRVIGGLAPAAPGYQRVRVAPQPGGGITRARTAHDTGYGRIEVAWALEAGEFRLDLEIPVGVVAEVLLPGAKETREVGPGAHRFTCPAAQVPLDADQGAWGAHEHVAV